MFYLTMHSTHFISGHKEGNSFYLTKKPEINQSNVLAKDSGKSDRSVHMANDLFQLYMVFWP